MKKKLLSIGIVVGMSISLLGQVERKVSVSSENEVRGSVGIMDLSLTNDRPIKVACVGNSITAGHGIDGKDNYPSQLSRMLGSGFNVGNFGASGAYLLSGVVPGWAYIEMSGYIPSKNFAPDVVIIKLGSNDTKPDSWKMIANYESDYKALIKSYRDLPSKPQIVLSYPAAVSGNGNFGINEPNVLLLMTKIKKIADDEGCEIVDFHSVTVGHPEYVYDYVHPNAIGYTAMARLANRRLREILAKSKEVTTDKSVVVLASPKEGYEFVEWTDGVNVYTKNPLYYSAKSEVSLTAKFRRIDESYCQPWGTTEPTRYIKKMWAEVGGKRVDIIGSDSTDVSNHSGKVIQEVSDAAIVVSPGQNFTLKSVSNNSSLPLVDAIRKAVIFPFVDWNRDLEFGGNASGESLPMIGRAGNDSMDEDAMAVVSLNHTIVVPIDAEYGKTILRLCYTDGFSSTVGLNESPVSHTACSPVEKGIVIDVVLQIVPLGGSYAFAFSSGEKGTVVADHDAGTYSPGTAIRLKAIPESNHVEFVSWTDENNNVISHRAEFVYYVAQNITLKANFRNRQYPRLTHWYSNASQVNRFLNKVKVSYIGGETTEVFNLGSNPTVIPVNKDLKDGTALTSYFDPKIRIKKGTRTFTLTCYSTHNVVEGLNNELGWTNQAVLVDWNQNYRFDEINEQSAPTTYGGANTVNHAFGNANGFSRNISIPVNQPVGVYRMYVVYGEPSSASSTWPITMVNDGSIRMGNVYEFEVEIDDPSGIHLTTQQRARLITNESDYTLTQLKEHSAVMVFDAMGRVLVNKKINSSSYSFKILGSGCYFIRIVDGDNQVQTLRFVR